MDHGRSRHRPLLAELEPTVEENLNRHLATADEWMPHEYVPWSLGRDFADLGGDPWEVAQSQLSPIARTALEVNLLTEDNLPSYHREIDRAFGRDSAWGTWVNRWTAEEGRHAFCIRDYLLVTRGVDPVELERARMETMESGYEALDKSLLNVCAYVSFQELATRISHRNTGRYTEEPIAEKLLSRVAKDENLHMLFYRNIVTAALELAPSQTMRAITEEVVDFQMPGSVIPGFARKAVQMAKAGIYDLRIHHDDIVTPAAAAVGRVGARGPRRGRREGARRAGGGGRRPSTARRPASWSAAPRPRPRRPPVRPEPSCSPHERAQRPRWRAGVVRHRPGHRLPPRRHLHRRAAGRRPARDLRGDDRGVPRPPASRWATTCRPRARSGAFPASCRATAGASSPCGWLQAYDAGVAAPVVLAATSERALDVVPLDVLRSLSVDVPPDLSAWE